MSRPLPRCPVCGRLKAFDAFSGAGGAGLGYMRAGFCVDAIDKAPENKTPKGQRTRLENFPRDCEAQNLFCVDAVEFIYEKGHKYAAGHGSPTCTGYSRGTAAVPDRFARYDRLIAATREAMQHAGILYVIENVEDAKSELVNPAMLCGRQFGLSATDDDGTPLVLDRHRLFETNWPLMVPEHPPHAGDVQVAGAYGGGRRDKWEAKYVRKGGYVPPNLDVLRELLGTPWMNEKECFLSIPPAYTEFVGGQLHEHLERVEGGVAA